MQENNGNNSSKEKDKELKKKVKWQKACDFTPLVKITISLYQDNLAFIIIEGNDF